MCLLRSYTSSTHEFAVHHVHFHILPRKSNGDRFSGERNDEIYPELERSETALANDLLPAEPLKMDNEERVARSMGIYFYVYNNYLLTTRAEEMEKEAQWLSSLFTAERN